MSGLLLGEGLARMCLMDEVTRFRVRSLLLTTHIRPTVQPMPRMLAYECSLHMAAMASCPRHDHHDGQPHGGSPGRLLVQ